MLACAVLQHDGVTSLHSVARRPLPTGPNLGGPPHLHTQADLRSPEARGALAGVDVLFHLGFQLWQGKGGRRAMADANLEGTRNVLAARPGRVVLASSAAVYGAWPDNPRPMAEDHPPRPNPECPYAADKLAVERWCSDAAPCVALRISAVLGTDVDRRVARSTQGYRLAVPAIRGADQAVQFLDQRDAVAALLAAGWSNAIGPCNVATIDWLDATAIASIAGSRVVVVPRRLLLGAAEFARRSRLAPFGADRAVLVAGPLALSVGHARQLIGWQPTFSSAQVLATALGRSSSCASRRGLAS